jgi:hypothetical protein
MWACEYGQHTAIGLLLTNGVNVNSLEYTGLAGLHWAAAGGRPDTIVLLLKYGASLETKNYYGGTPLNQALWWPLNGKPVRNYVGVIKTLLEAGGKAEPGTLAWLAEQKGLATQEKAVVEEMLRRYGANS